MNNDDPNLHAIYFVVMLLWSFLLVMVIANFLMPEIEREELYRFCLVKNIPLSECVIPPKPYKKEPNE